METLDLPRSLGPRAAGGWISAWREVASAERLHLVMPEQTFLEPAGIALLAAGIAERQRNGLPTWLRSTASNEDLERYLQWIDFYEQLGVERPEDFAHHSSEGRFVPLRRIVDLRTARELAYQVGEFLEARFPDLASSPIRATRFLFEELGANIVQHSGLPETGFGLVQSFPKASRFQIAFADAGVGIRGSLQENLELAGRIADDAEAIRLAISSRVSSRNSGNLGIGLSFLRDFAERLGAELWIASGDAVLCRSGSPGERRESWSTTAGWQGVWVCLDAVGVAPAGY